MSYLATAWAWEQDFKSPLRKMIMLYIADCANPEHDWKTWHAFRTIAKACNCSIGSVSNHMGELVDAGYLTLLRRGTKRGETNMYRLNVGAVHIEVGPGKDRSPDEHIENNRSSVEGDRSSVVGDRSSVGGGRSSVVDKPVIQPVNETVIEPISKSDRRSLHKPLKEKFTPPDWIPAERWSAYLLSRKEKKHPMNAGSLGLCVRAIEKTHAEGISIDVIMDQMIESGWRSCKAQWFQNGSERGSGQRMIDKREENRLLQEKITREMEGGLL